MTAAARYEAPPPVGGACPYRHAVGTTRRERHHLAVLERRIAFLRDRATWPEWRGTSYDDAEVAALEWLLTRVADAEDLERRSFSAGVRR